MNSTRQAYGSYVITDELVYTNLWKQTKNKDIEHVLFAEQLWRQMVYGIARKDQDDPIAFQMAQHDIIELKAQGVLVGDSQQQQQQQTDT